MGHTRSSAALTAEALSADIGRNRGVRKGVGQFERKFPREWGSSTNDCWRQKSSPWTITWRCLRDPTFSLFDTIAACGRQTQTDTR